MFPRHYTAFCPTCSETTPHEDHRIGRWISIALGLAGIALVVLVALSTERFDMFYWLGILVYGGAWFSLDRHEKHVNERCTRCRHKARKAWRKTQPDPRNSTIDLG